MSNKLEIPSEQTTRKENRLLDILAKHSLFTVVCGITTIIGTLLGVFGVYAYYASIKAPELTYYVSSTRTAIVQKGKVSALSVKYNDNTITGDLSSAEIQIWNAGNAPITREDILKPITLKLGNGGMVYGIDVTNNRDYIVSNTNVIPQAGVGVTWNILQQNDGIKLQIIYGGSVNVPITLDGVIKGQKQVITSVESLIRSRNWSFIFVGFISLCLVYMIYELTIRKKTHILLAVFILVITIEFSVFICIRTARLDATFDHPVSSSKPPFGF